MANNASTNTNVTQQCNDQLNNSSMLCFHTSEKSKEAVVEKHQKGKHKILEGEKLKRDLDKKKKDFEKEQERKKKELEKEEERKRRDEEKKKKEEDKKLRQAEKNEDKRRKEEERRLKEVEKEEEKRKRDEDKKRKDEERRKDENEKSKFLKKPRTSILDFFLKKDKIDQEPMESIYNFQDVSFFKPIEVKKDMRIASLERTKKPLIQSLADVKISIMNYIQEIENNMAGTLFHVDSWPISEPDCEVFEPSISRRISTKFFLFAENVRPPYFGTWRKTSKCITPLNPLSEDTTILDYEIDSDQEWEYESGEDISNSEGEEEEEVNEDVEDNSFLVPHDYLSDGEDCSDVDNEVHDGNLNYNKRSMSPKSRQSIIEIREKQFQAEVKQKVQIINPFIIGPFYEDNNNTIQVKENFEPYRMICQSVEGLPINCNLQSDVDYSISSTKMKSVPIEAVPLLIRLLHHNSLSRAKICYEFRMYWEYHLTNKLPDVTFDNDVKGRDWDEFTIGKKRLIDKIKEIAERKDGKWIVKPEVIHEYQLCCVDDDPLKACSEQWKYVSEVLKENTFRNFQRKSKVVHDTTQQVIAIEQKQPKKRRQVSVSTNINKKLQKDVNLNSSVQLVDNVKGKVEELKAKEMLCCPNIEDIPKELF